MTMQPVSGSVVSPLDETYIYLSSIWLGPGRSEAVVISESLEAAAGMHAIPAWHTQRSRTNFSTGHMAGLRQPVKQSYGDLRTNGDFSTCDQCVQRRPTWFASKVRTQRAGSTAALPVRSLGPLPSGRYKKQYTIPLYW